MATVGEYVRAISKIDEEIEDIERTLADTGVPVGAVCVPASVQARFAVGFLRVELARKREEKAFLCRQKVETTQKEKSPE